ncbi:hypothetical protein NDU88_006186 [Pleurodeles waltl]|uniref:Uncharacterized protein n=1 Tax=Pleurodeles waltl TaxID=8319 RepID=A0AAV7VNH0_PLEWA|nr:hypothetical protein NDU88_006186 [Pleurodeles waltl]
MASDHLLLPGLGSHVDRATTGPPTGPPTAPKSEAGAEAGAGLGRGEGDKTPAPGLELEQRAGSRGWPSAQRCLKVPRPAQHGRIWPRCLDRLSTAGSGLSTVGAAGAPAYPGLQDSRTPRESPLVRPNCAQTVKLALEREWGGLPQPEYKPAKKAVLPDQQHPQTAAAARLRGSLSATGAEPSEDASHPAPASAFSILFPASDGLSGTS